MTRSRDLADSADKDISGTLVVDSLTSSGNVGIGGSASQRLHVQGGSLLIDNGSSAGTIYLHDTTNYINLSSDAMQFATNGSERVRIDSSGNLLVGKTTTAATTNGTFIGGGGNVGLVEITRDGNYPLRLNRKSSDGTILRFDKDGTSLGIIGVGGSNDLLLYSSAADHTGIRLGQGYYIPINNSGAASDATVDIGLSSFRYKDLHLSGTVNAQELKSPASQTFTHLTGSVVTFRNSSNQERMRIDSNGKLLVGKTSTAFGTVGVEVQQDGELISTRAGTTAHFNRISSNGDILQFYKDGALSGSVGANGSNLYIGSPEGGDAYLGFGNQIIRPVTSSGASRDAAIDLGYTGMRFRNAYLSGGVYLGGTGSANLLDDYETGTFNATWVGTGTSGPSSTMYYTKIGNTVHISGYTVTTAPNPTGAIELSGLPFTASYASSGSMLYRNITASSGQHTLIAFVPGSSTHIQPYWSAQGSYSKLQKSQLNASNAQDMYFGATYITS